MTTCLGKSCSFVFLYVSFVDIFYYVCVCVCVCVCPSFPFGFERGIWDLIFFYTFQ